MIKEPDLVVAIDVGSTYSRYAFQYRSDFEKDKGNIEFNLNWGLGTPEVRSTCITYILTMLNAIRPHTFQTK